MRVVFLQDVEGTAQAGEIKEVADGFARNFLLPRKMALAATKSAIQQATAEAQRVQRTQAKLDAAASATLAKVVAAPVAVRARVGEQGRLFGSITSADIAEALKATTGQEIDRHAIDLGEPIKELGEHTVRVRLSRNVSGDLVVRVEAEE